MEVSQILQSLEPSATLAMSARAKELKASGRTVYNLSVGEPDFGTPEHICAAAVDAMKNGFTRYTVASGIPELKKAVVDVFARDHGVSFEPNQVVISNGAKHALHNAFTATLNPGDECIIPAPYWVSYAELVKLTGAKPVIVSTTEAADFKLTPEQLRAACTPKTKMLLLCSPSNPTGSMYSAEELGTLADVCIEKDLIIVADEIYEKLVYGGRKFASFVTVRPGLADRTILINGVSKTYAMTGWRIGWSMAPVAIAKSIAALQSQQTSNPCSISQYAAIAALRGPQDCVVTMRAEFEKRRHFVKERIASIDGLSCTSMDGAFYAFFNIQKHLGRMYGSVQIDNSAQWCLGLLEQKGVATVMGSAFGAEGYVRASFASSMEHLEKAFDLIEDFLS